MSTFNIDFFELSFLAEACIPPRPIARTYFWQNLSKVYWYQMTENERERLFEWINRNELIGTDGQRIGLRIIKKENLDV